MESEKELTQALAIDAMEELGLEEDEMERMMEDLGIL